MDESEARPKRPWNNDPQWAQFIETLRPTIRAIAAKYTADSGLAEDAVQEAMLGLLYVYPEDIRGHREYELGNKSEEEWKIILTSYCLTAARNRILVALRLTSSGNLYVGRSHTEWIDLDGEKVKIRKRSVARFVSLDMMLDNGVQIKSSGEVCWKAVPPPELMHEED